AFIVLLSGGLLPSVDFFIVNVSLPSIHTAIGATPAEVQLVVSGYAAAYAVFLITGGRLGDLYGRRRLFLIGLAVFTGASLLCAAAENQAMLIGGRFFAGVGGAMASAVILGMIVTMFPEPREQAKAIGVYGFVASAGGSIGLLLGGALTQAISWHWIFIINLPIGLATAYGALRLVDGKPGIGFKAGADIPGAALITSSLMLGVYTILGINQHGWGSAQTLVLGAISFALGAAFVTRQARIENPLMPLRLFRSRNVAGANVIQSLLVAGMFGMFFLGALYLQRILGYDALQVGLAFLPATIVMGTLSLGFSEKLIMRFGPKTTLIPGVIAVGIGLLLFARTPVEGTYLADLLAPMLLVGLGVGTAFPSLMTLAMSGATLEDSGLASGLVNTSMQVGGAIGLAVLATLATERTDSQLADGASHLAALNSGYHLAYVVGAVLVAIATVVAVTVLKPAPMPSHEMAPAEAETAREGDPAYSEA
ncbi:MAG TPA: MFS transporter, partial [Gaiellales bacterium]|nr:MFS transporter [Gaiellales bacterium]